MTVRVRQKNPGAIRSLLDRHKNSVEIAIGLPAGSSGAGARYPDGTDLLDVAHDNEFGTSKIPERPFLRAGVRSNVRRIKSVATEAVKAVNAGEIGIEDASELVGQEAEAGVKEYITALSSPPNAPSTIRKKGSSNPLIDTGLLRQSINYEVRSKK